MNRWLNDITLKGCRVTLTPFSLDHRYMLVEAASDGALWELWYTSVPSEETIDHYIKVVLEEKEQGTALPFVVIDNESGQIIGSTRFCHALQEQRRVEIGYTWYAKSFQRTAVNTECKLLLLIHAFEVLDAIAVEFRTHWHNQASRAAIARLGAKQDGILRQFSRDEDGTYRDTVVFSILDSEWQTVKKGLLHKLSRAKKEK